MGRERWHKRHLEHYYGDTTRQIVLVVGRTLHSASLPLHPFDGDGALIAEGVGTPALGDPRHAMAEDPLQEKHT